jgi:hypothetical protein
MIVICGCARVPSFEHLAFEEIPMRPDMSKVIVERPRLGGGARFPRGSSADDPRLPMKDWRRREGIGRPWQSSSAGKWLNENLAPLRRYLRSNCGRSWNAVYSDVCQRINRNSAVQLHVWQHLMQDVCTNPYEISGEVGRWHAFRWRNSFYVDPRTGILREAPPSRTKHERRPTTEEPDDRIDVDPTHQFRRLDGIWYELELARFRPGSVVYDMGLRRLCTNTDEHELFRFYGRAAYAIRKRQLNSKEIRTLVRERGAVAKPRSDLSA